MAAQPPGLEGESAEVNVHGGPSTLSTLATLLALFAAAIGPFLGCLGFELVWDDHYLLRDLRAAEEAGGLPAVLGSEFLATGGVEVAYYRPIVQLSLWVGERLGSGPRGHHLVNLLLHLANTFLVAALVVALTRRTAAGLFGGALFAVHPAHVEPVSFVAGQTDLWATLFVLISALAWLRAGRAPAGRRITAAWCAVGLVAFAAAGLSKESALVLPAILVAWECLRFPQEAPRRRLVTTAAGYGAVALLVLILGRLVIGSGGTPPSLIGTASGSLLYQEPGVAAKAGLELLRQLVLPWPQNALYTRDQLATGILTLAAVVALAAIIALVARAGASRWAAGGAIWIAGFLFAALLIPSASEIPTAARYVYLPSVGVCFLLGALVGTTVAEGRGRRARWVMVLALLIAALGVSSSLGSRTWRDDLTLSSHQVLSSPRSSLAHQRLGETLLERGDYRGAFDALRIAVDLDPGDPAALNALGIALRHLGQAGGAADAFRGAIALDPDSPVPRLNLAYVCISLRDRGCIEEQRGALASIDRSALLQLEAELARPGR